jgi:hypothetical protein
MGQCAPEDSISQCPFLQMIDTAGNPHADGSAAPGARPRHRPSRHRDPPATSRAHDNWMAARQTSCRQQTAPPPPRCSKDVTAHPHRPGARPGRPCQVPARSGQPLSGRSGFSPAFGTEFFPPNLQISKCRISIQSTIVPVISLLVQWLTESRFPYWYNRDSAFRNSAFQSRFGVCVGCLFLRSPSRIPYRTELIPRAPKGRRTRTPHP